MDNRGNLNLIIAVLFVVILFMGVGLSYLSSRPVQDVATIALDANMPDAVEEIASVPTSATASPVTYVPEGAFSLDLRLKISARVLDPYREYSHFVKGDGPVVTTSVTLEDAGDTLFPYVAEFTHVNGIKHRVTVMRDGDTIGWWVPQCDTFCIYPDAFVEKYPEIVSGSSQ